MKLAILIPTPSHKCELYLQCRASVQAAWQNNPGPFRSQVILQCPYDTTPSARAMACNLGQGLAHNKKADWFLFLDVENSLFCDAYQKVGSSFAKHDAIWGNLHLQPGGPYRNVPVTSLNDVLRFDPLHTLQFGHFVRASVSETFDLQLGFGAQFAYFLSLWERVRCVKLPFPFYHDRTGVAAGGVASPTLQAWRTSVAEQILRVIERRGLTTNLTFQGRTVKFEISNPFDLIQTHHCHGRFFEEMELVQVQKQLGAGKSSSK